MYSNTLAIAAGTLGLAALAFAVPEANSATCVASHSTVFVTVQSIITVHDTPTSTIYVDINERPATTLTHISTLTVPTTRAFTTSILSNVPDSISTSTIEITASGHVVSTVTDVFLSSTDAGQIPSYSSSGTTEGSYSFIDVNGTTSWLNDQTPPPASSYIVETSIVTVEPFNTFSLFAVARTSTSTVKTTIFMSYPSTVKETASVVGSGFSKTFSVSIIDTDISSFAQPTRGWNVSSTANHTHTSKSHSTPSCSSSRVYTVSNSTTLYPTSLTQTAIFTATSIAYLSTQTSGESYINKTAGTGVGLNNVTLATSSPFEHTTKNASMISTATQIVSSYGCSSTTCSSNSNATISTFEHQSSLSRSASTSSSAHEGAMSFSSTAFSESVTVPSLMPTSITTSTTITGLRSSTSASSCSEIATLSQSESAIISTVSTTSTSILALNTSTIGSSVDHISSTFSTMFISFQTTSSIIQSSSTRSMMLSSMSSQAAAPSAIPNRCGETGDFMLSFDDIPPLSVWPNTTNINPEPVFSPYHQFDFSDGFTVVPPPTDPYLPSSRPLLVEFIPNFNPNDTSTMSDPNTPELGFSGDVGNGDHGLTGCFGFNAYGASFGCDSIGPSCVFSFTGLRYNRTSRATLPVNQQTVTIPACSTFAELNCELQPISLSAKFQNLDALRINVTVAGEPEVWWMDDLALGWYDNSCTAGMCRLMTHIH